MQEYVLSLFYQISQYLLFPILIGMSLAGLWLVFQTGLTLRQALDRWMTGASWCQYIDGVRKRVVSPEAWPHEARFPLHRWVAHRSKSTHDIEVFVRDAEVMVHRKLSRLQVLVRTGPMLGLVGTLLPLGPALEGLAHSDIGALGEHMNIAFTMTVFGIMIGALAYALFILHRSWAEKDLADLDLIHSLGNLSPALQSGANHDEEDSALGSGSRRRSAQRSC
ncbi:MotA/TolQ/ExbB proton channel family protein [Pirellula sp. SH-Sr6A]|uniref:MotA/TolQ/ExbB proton channel family protein n=1 Tax=Pirellula sp. SH-Sr6A TaxID=1632865 RepID=UPI0011BAE0A8|nr:MotA/TolQ/ExbB proton channel family protein [Pirellula sp. SH-Sr6A]